jgi:hypothetical protein
MRIRALQDTIPLPKSANSHALRIGSQLVTKIAKNFGDHPPGGRQFVVLWKREC